MTFPVLVLYSQSPEGDPDRDAEREHDETGERVVDVPDLQVDSALGPAGPRQADGVAATDLDGSRPRKVRNHLVGDDHGDRDREQRLTEILTLIPAEQRLLDDDADHGDDRGGDEHRQHPLPGRDVDTGDREAPLPRHLLLDLVGDVARQQVERPVGHVHHPHQAEDERETARDDEQEPCERERVEQDQEE